MFGLGKKYDVAMLSEIGKRSSQQDSIGYKIDKKSPGCFAVLADGMGGLLYGRDVSSLLVNGALELYESEAKWAASANEFLTGMIPRLNEKVLEMLESKEGDGGSTLIEVLISGSNLYFSSVGDSKLFLLSMDGSTNKISRLNVDHNFGRDLDQLAQMGKISYEEARGNVQRNALTSYMGAESVRLIDSSEDVIHLCKGDVIILASDGITAALSNEEIQECVSGYKSNEAVLNLTRKVEEKDRKSQDNYSAIVIRIL